MKPKLILITLYVMAVAPGAIAQNTTAPATAATPSSGAVIINPPVQTGAPAAYPAAGAGTDAAATATASPAAAPPRSTTLPANDIPLAPKNEIRMNFQGASLPDVLNYLSSAAGFVIVQETPVTGTVNIMSQQPMNADEAVAVLNSVLISKGYVAIRDGRILKIVSKTGVQARPELPVIVGKEPELIPKSPTVATQIMPVRYVDATKLVENLRPLLPADATISVNEGSNAILLTDTQADIHRMAEIIKALDTSVSSISTIKVYPLRYADAKDFANVLTQLFTTDQSTAGGRNAQGGGPGAFFARFGGGGGRGGPGGGGGDQTDNESESEARKAATRVVAVPDTQSNSVVVSAPDEYIPTIDEIVARLDTSTTDVTQTRLFQLEHADATTVSTILNQLYGDPTSSTSTNNRNNQQGNRGGNRGGNPFGQQPATAATTPSERQLLQARMVAVPDPRTNSILVNCSADTMVDVAQTIGKLDATNAKKQEVHTIALQHADPDAVVGILRTVFGDTSSTTTETSALQQRTINGASTDVTNVMSNSGGTSGGGGGLR